VQANVDSLIVIHVNRHLLHQAQPLSVGRLDAFQVCPDHVIGFARGYPLGKFTVVVGGKLPLSLLIPTAANFDHDSVHGAVVRSPNRTENQGVRIIWLKMLIKTSAPCRNWKKLRKKKPQQKKQVETMM
jgi:hypothetical protein